MAKAFNLTAQINLQGPANIKPVVAKIKRELGSVSTNVDIKFESKAAKNVSLLSKNLRNLNTVLAQTSTNARTLTAALGGLNTQLKDLTSVGKINASLEKTSQKIKPHKSPYSIFELTEFVNRFSHFFVHTGDADCVQSSGMGVEIIDLYGQSPKKRYLI